MPVRGACHVCDFTMQDTVNQPNTHTDSSHDLEQTLSQERGGVGFATGPPTPTHDPLVSHNSSCSLPTQKPPTRRLLQRPRSSAGAVSSPRSTPGRCDRSHYQQRHPGLDRPPVPPEDCLRPGSGTKQNNERSSNDMQKMCEHWHEGARGALSQKPRTPQTQTRTREEGKQARGRGFSSGVQ